MSSPTTKLPEDSELQRQLKTSEAFNASDADILFKSSDNVLFRIHRKNLEVHAAGFPPPAFNTNGETVSLSEDASTLENLFPYIYPLRHPGIDLLPFEDLLKVAEAAEKYEFFSVMHVCRLRMVQLVPQHPADILNYAFMHDYPDIMESTVPYVLDLPLDEVATILVPKLVVAWIRYREAWLRAACKAVTRRKCHYCGPVVQSEAYGVWVEMGDKRSPNAVSAALKSLQDMGVRCQVCPKHDRNARPTVQISTIEDVVRGVPTFTSYL